MHDYIAITRGCARVARVTCMQVWIYGLGALLMRHRDGASPISLL